MNNKLGHNRSPAEMDVKPVYRIRYRHCGTEWEDIWSCACDSECPVCGAAIEAYDSELILRSMSSMQREP
jgi:hypothetical protein